MKGVNIFSHNGGVALGLKEDVEFILYTSFNETLKGVLESRIAKGELPRAPIIKFSYTIAKKGEKADVVAGLVHHRGWQERELTIPDERDGFPPSSGLTGGHIHRASLYESLMVAKIYEAPLVLLFFPYDPLSPDLGTLEVLKGRGTMRCFEFPLQGLYIPSKYLYLLEISRGGAGDLIEFIQLSPLLIRVPNKGLSPPRDPRALFALRSALVWDISPLIIRECWERVKRVPRGGDYLLRIYYSPTEKPQGDTWNHNELNPDLLNVVSQRASQGTLGWGSDE